MAVKYKAYKEVDGTVFWVEEGSEADLNRIANGEDSLILGLDSETSDDGLVNQTPALVQKPREDKVTGRYYLYTANRWVTDSDDNYSTAYVLFNEQAGSGIEPLYEWEHIGEFYKAGTTIKDFTLTGRANNAQVTDLEIRLVAKYPIDPNAWLTGFGADSEVDVQVLYSGTYKNMGVTAGNLADMTAAKIDLNVTLNQSSYICMYVKAGSVITGTRYFTGSRILGVL